MPPQGGTDIEEGIAMVCSSKHPGGSLDEILPRVCGRYLGRAAPDLLVT